MSRFVCLFVIVVSTVFFYTTSPTALGNSDITGEFSSDIIKGDASQMKTVRSGSCEIIDLAIVVRGYNSSRDATILLKSVLVFRKNPIRFHFIVDPIAKHILSTLMRTWHLYGVDYHFYDTFSIQRNLVREDKMQCTGIDDVVLLLGDGLPCSAQKVIFLDPSVLVTADIFHLWMMFHDMHQHGSVLGIVKSGTPETSREEEIRSEVMLIDCRGIREQRWLAPWKDALSKSSNHCNSSGESLITIALSYIYREHQGLFSLLNPGWNVCQGVCGESDDEIEPCYRQQTVCARSFRKNTGDTDLKLLFQEYDGNLLCEKMIDCETSPEFDQNALDYRSKTLVYAPPCSDFLREGSQERRTHPFFLEYDHVSSDPNDVTLLLHGTLDRLLSLLEPMCRHWEGPVSIAVCLYDSEVSSFLNLISSSPIIRSRRNIGYHIVYKEGVFYPSNPLRNVALQNARTPYVLFNDIDFLPSFGLYPYLKRTVSKFGLSKTVLVVPAFEVHTDPKTFIFPQSKSALLTMVAHHKVSQFHRKIYIRGHAPTDYPKWERATKPYKIQWQPSYEPYLVASANITPLDTRFISRNFNKVSFVEELYYQRYQFYVLPDGFILHLPHTLSSDAISEKANERQWECYSKRKNGWRADMVQKYGYEPYLVHVYKLWNRLSSSYETTL